MKCRFQERASFTPYFPSVLPPPTRWPPRRRIYSVRKAERRRHWRLIFFICTEHFLQLFWTNSKHLNLFFRIWLMLENIVSRWKYGQTWLIWTCLQTPLENTLRLPPPCAYAHTRVHAHVHAQFCGWQLDVIFSSWWPVHLSCVCTHRDTKTGGDFCGSR